MGEKRFACDTTFFVYTHTHRHMYTHTHTHTHTIEYYLTIKNEILPFVTPQLELEDIMFSEINQKKINALGFHFHV